jgi:hypothetical protein
MRVLLVDNNWDKVTDARQKGAETCFGSIVSDKTLENINLEGIGKFIALTSNKGINSLSAIYFSKLFESANVYQVNTAPKFNQQMKKELRVHFFSSEYLTSPDIEKFEDELVVKANKITEEFTFEDLLSKYGPNSIHPLFMIDSENKVTIYSDKYSRKPEPGETLITLIFRGSTPNPASE